MIMLKGDETEEQYFRKLRKKLIKKEAEKELINKKGREEFNK